MSDLYNPSDLIFTNGEQPALSKWNKISSFFSLLLGAIVPVGGVMHLWGSASSLPTNFLLCNGQTVSDADSPYNGLVLPNLIGKFIRGANGNVMTMTYGGADSVTLGATNIPSHSHSVSITTGEVSSNHTHTFTTSATGAHQHYTLFNWGGSPGSLGPNVSSATNDGNPWGSPIVGNHSHTGTTDGISSNHTHNVSGNTGSYGSGSSFSNLPTYGQLLPIIRIK